MRVTRNIAVRYDGSKPAKVKPDNQHTAESRRRKRWPKHTVSPTSRGGGNTR